jgi:hypothetical protein
LNEPRRKHHKEFQETTKKLPLSASTLGQQGNDGITPLVEVKLLKTLVVSRLGPGSTYRGSSGVGMGNGFAVSYWSAPHEVRYSIQRQTAPSLVGA